MVPVTVRICTVLDLDPLAIVMAEVVIFYIFQEVKALVALIHINFGDILVCVCVCDCVSYIYRSLATLAARLLALVTLLIF